MNTANNTKKVYTTPELTFEQIDNEISLQLDSMAPFGPGEASIMDPLLMQDPNSFIEI
jgi:hypothetical protein